MFMPPAETHEYVCAKRLRVISAMPPHADVALATTQRGAMTKPRSTRAAVVVARGPENLDETLEKT